MSGEVQIWLSLADNGVRHLTATSQGATAEETLAYVEEVAAIFAGGKQTVFRARPEISTERDFDTKETRHQGFVRFSYLDTPGEWRDAEQSADVGFGDVMVAGAIQ